MLAKKIYPFAIFLVLAGILWKGLMLKPDNFKKSQIPEFHLTKVNNDIEWVGNEVFLNKELSLVTFWASWCTSCLAEHEFLKEVVEKNSNIQFIGVSINDEREKAKEFFNLHGNPFDIALYDPYSALATLVSVKGTPETIIVNSFGEIKYKYSGPITKRAWNKIILPQIEKNIS